MYQRFVLTYGAESETLTINPEGWNENGQSFQRDRIYHGVFQTYTVNTFRFAKKSGGGGDFIANAYDTDGIKAVVTVDVYNRNPQTDDYNLSYSGKLNFDPAKFSNERDFFEIGFVQSGLLQKFITRDELELDINQIESVDGVTMNAFSSSPKSIAFPPIDIYRQMLFDANFEYLFYFNTVVDSPSYGDFYTFDQTVSMKSYAKEIYVNEPGDDLKIQTSSTHSERSITLYENPFDYNIDIEIDSYNILNNTSKLTFLNRRVPGLQGYVRLTVQFVLARKDSDDNVVGQVIPFSQQYTVDTRIGDTLPNIKNINYDLSSLEDASLVIPAGGKLDMYIFFNPDEAFSSPGILIRHSGKLEVNFDIYEKSDGAVQSDVSCYFPHEAFTRLFQLVTSRENTFYSVILGRSDSEFISYSSNGAAAYDAIATGWNLRRFPDKPFTLNIRDLFKTFDSIYNLGLGYDIANERFYIARKEDFFDKDTYLFDLGEVSELKIKGFSDGYYNQVKGGFENRGEYESLDGIKEFATEYSLNADQPVKETLNIRSKYHADSIGMEFARRKNYVSYASEDTDYDDLIYIARTNGSTVRQGGISVSGFRGVEQYYNISITPRENALRWGNFLKSQYWKEENFTIKFSKGKKAVNITYQNRNGDLVNEFDDIQESELPDVRLFNPEIYEFESTINLAKIAAIKANPHGLIQFSFNSVSYVGFIDEIVTKDYDRQADYKLIAYEATADVQKIFMDGSEALFMDGDKHKFN